MQAELSVISAFLKYNTWESLHDQLTTKDFPEDLQNLYRCLDSFHKTQNEERADIHVLDLASLFFSSNKNNKSFYEGVFDTLKGYEPSSRAVRALITSLKRGRVLRDLSITSYEVAEGKKPYEEVQKLLSSLGSEVGDTETEEENPFITDSLSSLLDSTYKTPGLRWRLNALNRSLGSLRKGDFGFIFARPETGKTTFLASEVTYMAEQASGPVLWINNEEVNEKVKTRLYQAALGVSLQELLSKPDFYEKVYRAKLEGRILMPNQSTYSRWDVEKLCKRIKPGLVVVDQLPKITGFKEDRDDLKLGAIFQWARELAKEYCPVIGASQAAASGENSKWLTMNDVAKAKTEIQAEADWILGIGKIHDTGWENMRFLNISKNKLAGDQDSDPDLRHGRMEVRINAVKARYEDI